jgi:hypothetical protein
MIGDIGSRLFCWGTWKFENRRVTWTWKSGRKKKSGEGFVGCVNRYTVSMVTLTLAALFASSRIVISFFPLLT